MPSAISSRDIPAVQAARAAAKVKRDRANGRQVAVSSKTFEQLTPPQKDDLLKSLAIQAGLILDSD